MSVYRTIGPLVSVILELRAITVVVSHEDTLKHRFDNHSKLGLNIILTSFAKPPKITLQSIRFVSMFLESIEHNRGIGYLHIL